jgi:hypothetical protein
MRGMLVYIATFSISFTVLIFLKFVEGSPVRSWRVVALAGVVLGAATGYYFNHAFPAKAAPAPASQKVDAYRAELERTFRRIDGVDSASIKGSEVRINFATDKPLPEIKQIALHCAATAAYFFRTDKSNSKAAIHITVRGQDRYEMEFDTNGGVKNEQVY